MVVTTKSGRDETEADLDRKAEDGSTEAMFRLGVLFKDRGDLEGMVHPSGQGRTHEG
jgi:hypothetical protein